jgi:hypothetical protein
VTLTEDGGQYRWVGVPCTIGAGGRRPPSYVVKIGPAIKLTDEQTNIQTYKHTNIQTYKHTNILTY